ncbi:uncharacterized protein LOC144651965 [Oculina patagonica]
MLREPNTVLSGNESVERTYGLSGFKRMKTILQRTNKTLQASTSSETHESDRAPLTCNVRFTVYMSHETDQYELRAADGQVYQVERLFPEFFTGYSKTSLAEKYKVKPCENGKVEQRPDDPLIQSWLSLYGGGSRD